MHIVVDSKFISKLRKALLGTGRPLTIACHMKKTYLVAVVSAGLPVVSVDLVVVSGAGVTTVVSAVDGTIVVSVPVPSSVPLSLHATNAPIAKINNSFFIVLSFVLFMNDFMLIQ